MAQPQIGIIVLDTGYNGPRGDLRLHVLARDYCHEQQEINVGSFRVPGYTPRPDGSDSVVNGHGAQACHKIVELLDKSNVPFTVFSVKIGDSGTPLGGTSPGAVPLGLSWASQLHNAYPAWNWVVYVNFDVVALQGMRPYFKALSDGGVPLVLPTGNNHINIDGLSSAKHEPFPTLVPGHVLAVAGPGPNSDYGQRTVGLAVNDVLAAPIATAWVAYSRYMLPTASAAAVVDRVKSLVTPAASWAGRSMTGGILNGPVR